MSAKLLDFLNALANPRRFAIVEALAEGELTFSQLMEAARIEDSSSLVFHLGKLKGLVERGDGVYSVTKEGHRLYRLLRAYEGTLEEDPGTRTYTKPLGEIGPPTGAKHHPFQSTLVLSRIFFAWLYILSLVLFVQFISNPGIILLIFPVSAAANLLVLHVYTGKQTEGRSTEFFAGYIHLILGFGWGLPHLMAGRPMAAVAFLGAFSFCSVTALNGAMSLFLYPALLLLQLWDLDRLTATGRRIARAMPE